MKLPKFIRWMMFNPITLISNLAKTIDNLARTIEIRRENFLINEYKSGRILQVDNDKNNKKYLLNLESN